MADYITQSFFVVTMPSDLHFEGFIEILERHEREMEEQDEPVGFTWIKMVESTMKHIGFEDDAGYFDTDQVVKVLQEYLIQFDPDREIGFAWANTCNKHRADAFGGGAMKIKKDGLEYISTNDFLAGFLEGVEFP